MIQLREFCVPRKANQRRRDTATALLSGCFCSISQPRVPPVTAASPEISSLTSTLPALLRTSAFSKVRLFAHCPYTQLPEEKEQRPWGGTPGDSGHLVGPGLDQRREAQVPCEGHDTLWTARSQPAEAGLATCGARRDWSLGGPRGDLRQDEGSKEAWQSSSSWQGAMCRDYPARRAASPQRGARGALGRQKTAERGPAAARSSTSTAGRQTACLTSEACPTSPSLRRTTFNKLPQLNKRQQQFERSLMPFWKEVILLLTN